ncbi:MAG: HAD-IIB family hydrolase [Henriciella sp.]|nr:HAD-IIB family hydrolase [Henriciella sp.]
MKHELINWIETQIRAAQTDVPLLLVSGAQGLGKSTALKAVQAHFEDRIAVLGIDEFYLTKAERLALANTVHSLFETRGPPGTHDLDLIHATIDQLRAAGPDTKTPLPAFDKRIDDRKPDADSPVFVGQPKAIILEGWLIGALPDPEAPSQPPMNPVEAQDTDGIWRRYQEDQLAGPYAALWDRADAFCHLMAPSFDAVLGWRLQQEETTFGLAPGTLPEDRRAWIETFILHYERLTKRMLSGGVRAGHCICVNTRREVELCFPLRPETPPLIVFSDLDGTLLDHDTYSFEPARSALNRLRASGCILVLSSSKTAAEMAGLRADMGFADCPAIVENGAGILPPDDHDAPSTEDGATYAKLIEALNAAPPDLRAQYRSFSDWGPDGIAEQTGLPLEAAERAGQRQFSEPGIWSGDDASLAAFKTALEAQGVHMRRGGRFLTLSFGSVKADRMAEIIARYTTPDHRPVTLALGDAPNDTEMIEAADFGVIIANPHSAPLPEMSAESSSRVVRTTKPGPYGWNEAVLQRLKQVLDPAD